MELLEAMELRHSVRSYEERALEPDAVAELSAFLAKCNQESGLHMQLVLIRRLYGPLRQIFRGEQLRRSGGKKVARPG